MPCCDVLFVVVVVVVVYGPCFGSVVFMPELLVI